VRKKVDAKVVEFFYTSVIPFNVIRIPTFENMRDMVEI